MKHISNVAFTLIKLTEFIVRLVIMVAGFAVILAVAYLLGWQYLQAPMGNDGLNAINNVMNAAHWWPKIPIWYTGQGAGVSFLWGYPLLPTYMVVILSQLPNFSLIGAFKLIGWLALPVSAMGMYLFVWKRLGNQTVGLIAGVLYLLMPVSWVWLYDWGFYAEVVSVIFFFPPLITYDRFLEGWADKKIDLTARLCLLATVVMLILAFWAHPNTFFMIIRVLLVYSPLYVLRIRRKINIKNILYALAPGIILFIVTVSASLFISGNFQYYAKLALPRSGPGKINPNDYSRDYTTPPYNFFGLGKIPQTEASFTHRNIVVPPLVWVLAIVGAVTAPFISVKLVGFTISIAIAMCLMFIPEVAYIFTNIPIVSYFLGGLRGDVIISKMLFPIMAGFGIWSLPGLIFKLFTFWIKFKNRYLKWFLDNLGGVITGVVALGLVGWAIANYYNYPTYMWGPEEARYGPYTFHIRDPLSKYHLVDSCAASSNETQPKPEYCNQTDAGTGRAISYVSSACGYLKEKSNAPSACSDFLELQPDYIAAYKKLVQKCAAGSSDPGVIELCPFVARDKYQAWAKMVLAMKNPAYWPKVTFNDPFVYPFKNTDEFNKEHADDQFLRLDVTPRGGGSIMGLNIINKASMVDLYTVQLNLLGPYWGYEQQMLFLGGDGKVETANEVAKYFGTKFLHMHTELDLPSITLYASSSAWQKFGDDNAIWEFKDAPKVWSLTEKKTGVLVIGDLKKRAFEPVFRTANKGGMPYDEFLLVDGEEYIDAYSLDDLKKFDIIMLFGYKYRSMNKAWRNLEKYVRDGGNLFISTGWQYVDTDWRLQQTPPVMPVAELAWYEKFNKASQYTFDSEFIKGVDISNFGPLEWDNVGWGVSLPGKVKDWAKPILAADGKPIVVAGTFGKGKVVWSGLNLIGHMHTFEYNQSELDFFHRLFKWLGDPATEDLSDSVTPFRNYPDSIKFTFNKAAENPLFYFRESYFPNWKATFVSGGKKHQIDIYRAGPGFKLMRIPEIKAGDTLTLEFKWLFPQYFYALISVITFLLLAVYVVIGNKLWIPVANVIRKKLNQYQDKFKKNWDEEE